MDELRLRVVPDEVLCARCVQVQDIDVQLFNLVKQMIFGMERHKGIGLAAPQVGVRRRLFVTHAPQDTVRIFINPHILAASLEEIDIQEGCLSIPKMYAVLSRSRDITVQAFDQHGKPFRTDASGMLARIILHEYDHLNGVLFWDHLDAKKRKKLQKQYRAS